MTVKYTRDHEWIRMDGDEAVIGITAYAQEQLGDLVYAELPEIGRTVSQGGEICVVESTKAASEVYAPVSGEVTAVNESLEEEPGRVNSDPLGEGWLIRLKLKDPGELNGLMDEAAYQAFVEGGS